jgi:hypothetical protein
LVLALLAASSPWWSGWLARTSPPGPAAGPLKVSEFTVTHYRDKGKVLVGDLRTSPAAVRLNDDVRLGVRFSAPAYCYLIAFNPDGSVQLCHPTAEGGEGAPDARPGQQAAFRYPADDKVFVLDAAGAQAFVLAASARPLPPFNEWKAQAGKIPWKEAPASGPMRWQFDGREFTEFPRERGEVKPREGLPHSLRELAGFFKGRPEFDAVHAIAFPVVDDRK